MASSKLRPRDIIGFAVMAGRLKRLPRTGWVFTRVPDPETVAEHSFRTALLAMLLGRRKGIDSNRLLRMALVHDLEEVVTGDIISPLKEKMPRQLRLRRAAAGLRKVLQPLPAPQRKELFDLWMDSELQKSGEAKLFKNIDRLELMLQAYEYERARPALGSKLQQFWDFEVPRFNDPQVKSIVTELSRLRKRIRRR